MQSFESAVISDIHKKTGPARCRIRPLTAECQLSVHALRTSRAFAWVSFPSLYFLQISPLWTTFADSPFIDIIANVIFDMTCRPSHFLRGLNHLPFFHYSIASKPFCRIVVPSGNFSDCFFRWFKVSATSLMSTLTGNPPTILKSANNHLKSQSFSRSFLIYFINIYHFYLLVACNMCFICSFYDLISFIGKTLPPLTPYA